MTTCKFVYNDREICIQEMPRTWGVLRLRIDGKLQRQFREFRNSDQEAAITYAQTVIDLGDLYE
jgi:hypothetical protein